MTERMDDYAAGAVGMKGLEGVYRHVPRRGLPKVLVKTKPDPTFGDVNADLLADKDPHLHRGDHCRVIGGTRWRAEAKCAG
jgi:hypothetical protein